MIDGMLFIWSGQTTKLQIDFKTHGHQDTTHVDTMQISFLMVQKLKSYPSRLWAYKHFHTGVL